MDTVLPEQIAPQDQLRLFMRQAGFHSGRSVLLPDLLRGYNAPVDVTFKALMALEDDGLADVRGPYRLEQLRDNMFFYQAVGGLAPRPLRIGTVYDSRDLMADGNKGLKRSMNRAVMADIERTLTPAQWTMMQNTGVALTPAGTNIGPSREDGRARKIARYLGSFGNPASPA